MCTSLEFSAALSLSLSAVLLHVVLGLPRFLALLESIEEENYLMCKKAVMEMSGEFLTWNLHCAVNFRIVQFGQKSDVQCCWRQLGNF